MKIVGVTPDNKYVIDGVYKYVGTIGLPLDIVLEELKDHDLVVSWPHYCMDGLKEGASPRSIKAKIYDSVRSIYGIDHANEIEKRLDIMMPTRQ